MLPPGPDAPLYSVGAFARRTGVAAVTLRAWERRYGFPRPSRARGGRRLYTERDIWTVLALRAHTEQGVPISRAIALLGEAAATSSAAHVAGDGAPLEAWRDGLLRALLGLAAARANMILSDALSQLTVEDVCLGLMQPTLNEIGRRWQLGEASVAQEHFATSLLRARLSSMLQHASADTDSPTILAACPPGEWHELGLLMICLFLARRQHAVAYLGANLPAEDLASLSRQYSPKVILLSAQTAQTAAALGDVLRRIQSLPPPRPAIGYGGWAFDTRPYLPASLTGTYLGPDARTAVATVEDLLQGRPIHVRK
jgi:DNA-binding transcriptional MerR regulator